MEFRKMLEFIISLVQLLAVLILAWLVASLLKWALRGSR